MFKLTYLYVKQHNITGLKYFGKTTQDPFKYKGSGLHWTRHLAKHGNDVTTIIIGTYIDKERCISDAITFSKNNNIVESTDWANLKIENLDGGDTSQTAGYKQSHYKISAHFKTCKWWNNDIIQTFAPIPPNDTFVLGRLKFNNVGSKLGAQKQRGKIWINNGITEIMITPSDNLPKNYSIGRLVTTAFAGGRHSAKGTHWWNNGSESKMVKESPGPDWNPGRINPSK